MGEEDEQSDERRIEPKPRPDLWLSKPLTSKPRHEDAENRKQRSHIQDLLLDIEVLERSEERGHARH